MPFLQTFLPILFVSGSAWLTRPGAHWRKCQCRGSSPAPATGCGWWPTARPGPAPPARSAAFIFYSYYFFIIIFLFHRWSRWRRSTRWRSPAPPPTSPPARPPPSPSWSRGTPPRVLFPVPAPRRTRSPSTSSTTDGWVRALFNLFQFLRERPKTLLYYFLPTFPIIAPPQLAPAPSN